MASLSAAGACLRSSMLSQESERAIPKPATVGELLGRRLKGGAAPTVVLAGFPSDEGVRRNNGRPGAALAPDAIRQAFYSFPQSGVPRLDDLLRHTKDLGNIEVSGDLEADQIKLAEAIAPWLAAGTIPVIVGGGHETAYGHFLAHAMAKQDVGILNWDAHPDVRPLNNGKGHSGSPFRQAILHPSGCCRGYVVAGLLEARLVPEHLEFITAHGGRFHWRSSLSIAAVDRIYQEMPLPLMTSFDMDAVDRELAPGVSAPAQGGMTAELWLYAATIAGRNPTTRSMDVVEVNPKFDPDGRTVRLAAQTLLAFLSGLAERSA